MRARRERRERRESRERFSWFEQGRHYSRVSRASSSVGLNKATVVIDALLERNIGHQLRQEVCRSLVSLGGPHQVIRVCNLVIGQSLAWSARCFAHTFCRGSRAIKQLVHPRLCCNIRSSITHSCMVHLASGEAA